jgi:spore germination protein GerM
VTERIRHAVIRGTLVLVAAFTISSCGIPTDSSPKAIPKNNVPFHLLSPSAPSTSTTVVPPTVAVPETIYLVDTGQHLTPVTRDIALPATLTQTLGALLDGPTEAESAEGMQSFLTGTPADVTASVANGVVTVNFTTNPVQVVGPDQILAVSQVVFTATAQSGIVGVLFQIAGQPIAVPTAGGPQVAGPVGRTTYAPQAPIASSPATAPPAH